ncbi:GDYXXLXY domain-containing protein [Defluviitalea saccharophila]|uniref:GDYXXLXY domain-containing protein n=1 Tax=Defluviitalea saccharophila TaxID=879970 RepID=A0ABZ2Y6R9_9FIRM
MKKKLLAVFIVIAVIQLAIPLSMIIRREITLSRGEVYKFQVEPVDPYDPFRGRYVDVRLKNDALIVSKDFESRPGQKVFVTLDKDQKGYAKFAGIQLEKPKQGNYFATKILYSFEDDYGKQEIHVEIPFDRYYMEEKLAPKAEQVYREEIDNAYLTIRFLKGFGVVEQLFINEMPIEDYLLTGRIKFNKIFAKTDL